MKEKRSGTGFSEQDEQCSSQQLELLMERVISHSSDGDALKREIMRGQMFQRELQAANERLERANEELASFGYAISHDLVAPLRRCGLLLKFIEEDQDPPLNDAAQEHLRSAVQMTGQLEAMVQGVLECSRAGTHIGLGKVALDEVIVEALQNLEALLDVTEATVEVGDLPAVVGDRFRLLQLFQNLLQNAIRYRSDRPLRIEVSAREARTLGGETAWRIDVKDNGVGIKEGSLKEVFRLFSRLQRDSEGAGIGLSICKRVVEAHGGEIAVTSEVGVGSTFQVILPHHPERD